MLATVQLTSEANMDGLIFCTYIVAILSLLLFCGMIFCVTTAIIVHYFPTSRIGVYINEQLNLEDGRKYADIKIGEPVWRR
jgi:hypothetical protein